MSLQDCCSVYFSLFYYTLNPTCNKMNCSIYFILLHMKPRSNINGTLCCWQVCGVNVADVRRWNRLQIRRVGNRLSTVRDGVRIAIVLSYSSSTSRAPASCRKSYHLTVNNRLCHTEWADSLAYCHVNKVALRWARLILGWVIVSPECVLSMT